ncbi:MAG: cache domain-containing protein, partial [Candidatus Omnitrophota bacterium]
MGKLRRFFARFLLKTLYRRLWLKTAVVMIVIITIPVVFLGFFLVENSQKTVRDSLLNSQREMVNRATGEISLWLKRVEDILSSTAEILGSMNLTPWQQETVLVGLALNQPLFMRISSIDLSGKAIASSDLGGTEWYFDPQATQKIMEKRIYISPVQFQKHPTPYVTVAVPVLTRKKLSGALLADVDLRSLWEIVDDIRKEKTGRAFLVSSEGSVLSHPDKKLVLRNEYLGGEGDVQLALAGKSGTREMRGE